MAKRGRPKGSTKNKKPSRPKLETKQELMDYLLISDDEQPFNEDVWELALEKAKENEGKEAQYTTTTIENPDGTKTIKKKRVGAVVITNPVSWYFRLNALNGNKQTQKIDVLPIEHNNEDEDEYEYEENPTPKSRFYQDEQEYNEIVAWINMFGQRDERKFLQQKYDNYYDTYEINDGADRVLLSVILSLEIDIYRLNKMTAKGEFVDIKTKEKVAKTLRETLEAMKWTKKQRSAKDELAQNRFTVMMEKACENGSFKTDESNYDNDEIDFLLQNVPIYMENMDWRQG